MSIFKYRTTNRSDTNNRQTDLFFKLIKKREMTIAVVFASLAFATSSILWLINSPTEYSAMATYSVVGIYALVSISVVFVARLSMAGSAYSRLYFKYKLNFGELAKEYSPQPKLAPFPDNLNTFQLTLGEVHDEYLGEPVEFPYWLTISEKDLFTNTFVFGAIGSGKTATMIYPALDQLLAYKADDQDLKPALFCLDVKGEFWERVMETAKDRGRYDNFISLKVEQSPKWAYNTLNYPNHSNERLAQKLQEVLSMLQSGDGGGGDSGQYWNDLAKDYLVNAIALTRVYSLSKEVTVDGSRDLSKLDNKDLFDNGGEYIGAYITLSQLSDILSMESTLDEYVDEVTSFKDDLIKAKLIPEYAEGVIKVVGKYAYFGELLEQINAYFGVGGKLEEFKAADREFSIMKSMVDQVLGKFNSPSLRPMFSPSREDAVSGKVNMIDFNRLIDEGWLFVLQMSIGEYGDIARAVGALLKLDFFNAARFRISSAGKESLNQSRPLIFLVDEYQEFVSSGDGEFFGVARQSKVAGVVATQSYPALLTNLNENQAETLLSNFVNKVSLRSLDEQTSKKISGWGAKREIETASTSYSGDAENISSSTSVNRQLESNFDESVLMTMRNYEAIFVTTGTALKMYAKPYYLRRDVDYFRQAELTAKITKRPDGSIEYKEHQEAAPNWMLAKFEGNRWLYSANNVLRAILYPIRKLRG